jgi:hypothetical protein
MSSPSPAHTCHICLKPVDLNLDRYTDENGQIVHEDCYLKQIRGANGSFSTDQHAE